MPTVDFEQGREMIERELGAGSKEPDQLRTKLATTSKCSP
jgi:hypothetical protein